MKRDPKPFVVEVKRGTRRSSFLEQYDQMPAMTDAQRRADAALFAPPPASAAPEVVRAEPSRRILPSLVEPKPAVIEVDETDPSSERRPRPVGRPRKPRPVELEATEAIPHRSAHVAQPPRQEAPPPPAMMTPVAEDVVEASPPPSTVEARVRLRDRSAILARYVLGTKPAPGARWARSGRRPGRDLSSDR